MEPFAVKNCSKKCQENYSIVYEERLAGVASIYMPPQWLKLEKISIKSAYLEWYLTDISELPKQTTSFCISFEMHSLANIRMTEWLQNSDILFIALFSKLCVFLNTCIVPLCIGQLDAFFDSAVYFRLERLLVWTLYYTQNSINQNLKWVILWIWT